VETTGSCYYVIFEKKIVKRLIQCHVYGQSPLGRQQSEKYPIKLRTIPDLCKNDLLPVIFNSNGNSYTTSTQSDVCIHTYILRTIETLVGQN
jgi:hypothetical protein